MINLKLETLMALMIILPLLLLTSVAMWTLIRRGFIKRRLLRHLVICSLCAHSFHYQGKSRALECPLCGGLTRRKGHQGI